MTNQKKLDHYVYCLKDSEGTIRYIGEGRNKRYKSRNRTQEFLSILNNGGKTEILISNLSKKEALDKEEELIKYHKTNLLNILSSSKVKYIKYDEFKEVFVLCEDSPSGLAWNPDYSNGKGGKYFKYPGSTDFLGYYRIGFKNKGYKCHRIVWCLYNQRDLDTDLVIDHIDGNKQNNSPSNLEAVSVLENNVRCRWTKDRNPSYSASKQVYIASVVVDGTTRYRSFSISKYGKEMAYNLAKELLTKWIDELCSRI